MPRSRAYIRKGAPQEQPLLFEAKDVAHTDAKDFFPTPVADGVRFIREVGWDFRSPGTPSIASWACNGDPTMRERCRAVVFDPSCGHGNLLSAAKLCGARRTIGLELSSELASMASRKGHLVARVDALSVPWPRADFLIGNPPYSCCLDFAWKAVEWSRQWGRPAAFLLELDFLASAGRREINQLQERAKLRILSDRISFMGGDGSTSKRNYAWFCWGDGGEGTYEVW